MKQALFAPFLVYSIGIAISFGVAGLIKALAHLLRAFERRPVRAR
jgi:predicted membrane metal-binding protein